MNQVIKEKWVKALRSNKYQQGVTYLRTIENKYCCLGVLCDLYRKETKTGKWINKKEGSFSFVIKNDKVEEFAKMELPSFVAKWAGFRKNNLNPSIKGIGLAELNDNGKSFTYIANLIEKNL